MPTLPMNSSISLLSLTVMPTHMLQLTSEITPPWTTQLHTSSQQVNAPYNYDMEQSLETLSMSVQPSEPSLR